MDLAEARRRAFEWKERVSNGENPSFVKAQTALAAKNAQEHQRLESQKAQRTFSRISAMWLLENFFPHLCHVAFGESEVRLLEKP